MDSKLPHLQQSAGNHRLVLIGSSGAPESGICRAGVRRISRGFTMIELAISIFIIALLLGTILVPLQTQVEQRQVSESQKTLDDIKEALLGYAIATGHLPCPDRTTPGAGTANDTANDGVEDFNTATGDCFSVAGTNPGNIPWVTLGLGATDPWGNRFRYRVEANYARRAPGTPPNLGSAANIIMCTTAPCAVRLTPTAPDGAVAVILSHGKNGYGAINALTGNQQPLPTSADELTNLGGPSYVSRTITPLGATAGEFDDIVTWLGKYTLFNRMVAAGQLP